MKTFKELASTTNEVSLQNLTAKFTEMIKLSSKEFTKVLAWLNIKGLTYIKDDDTYLIYNGKTHKMTYNSKKHELYSNDQILMIS